MLLFAAGLVAVRAELCRNMEGRVVIVRLIDRGSVMLIILIKGLLDIGISSTILGFKRINIVP